MNRKGKLVLIVGYISKDEFDKIASEPEFEGWTKRHNFMAEETPYMRVSVARAIVSDLNHGRNFIISTMCDFMVRELSNCLLAYNIPDKKLTGNLEVYFWKHKLKASSVKCYEWISQKKQLSPCKVSQTKGIITHWFDEAINTQNDNEFALFELMDETKEAGNGIS